MTTTVPISEAKLILEKLAAVARAGDEVIIDDPQSGKLRLEPLTPEPPKGKRVMGLGRGSVMWISPDFDDPIDPETDPDWADWAKEDWTKPDLGEGKK